MSSEEIIHLYVEVGPDTGRQMSVPATGARIGRTENNDIVINDPSLSRFHCRVYFKDKHLWVADLGSTNETMVNHKSIHEAALHSADRITIGDTTLLVINEMLDGSKIGAATAASSIPKAKPEAPPAETTEALFPTSGQPPKPDPSKPEKHIDLGFDQPPPIPKSPGMKKVLFVLIFCVVLVAVLAVLKLFVLKPATQPGDMQPREMTFEFYYEKVQASISNIFRYELSLRKNVLAVRIDNLEDKRHITREKTVDPDVLRKVARSIEEEGYFGLNDTYPGIAKNVFDIWDLTVTINNRSKRTVVSNRIEPEEFKKIRTIIEEYAQNELGIIAKSLPPEQLLELAQSSFLNAQKLFAERDVQHGNLYKAQQAFKEAIWHLETIDPKPDYYATTIQTLEDCKRLIQERFDSNLFQAERAIVLKDWENAASHLRIICEMVPDRGDDRHKKAEIKLIDVERHIKR